MGNESSQSRFAFFEEQGTPKQSFPESYQKIWDSSNGLSKITKAKDLLNDYTKESSWLGSFWGLFFAFHWNRHHVAEVQYLVERTYRSIDNLVHDLNQLHPRPGGSLDRRIAFINEQTDIDVPPGYFPK